VFSLLELIKSNWRAGRPLYALFVDLKSAYDMVHPQALWAVLRHMGVPDNFTQVLQDLVSEKGYNNDPSRCSVRTVADGYGSRPGRRFVPLLFNLFIESLGRHIAALPGLTGVTVGSGPSAVTVKELKYADDICNPSNDAHLLQLVANETDAWCRAWGMVIGMGAKKTELVAFIPPRNVKAHPALPLITIRGIPVEWVSEYRYLGFELRSDLSDSGAVGAMAKKLSSQWQRYFHSSRLVRLHSPALILQLFKTVVLGSTNYLLALSNPSLKAASAINTATLKAIRTALRLDDSAPNSLVRAEGRALAERPSWPGNVIGLQLKCGLLHSPTPTSLLASSMHYHGLSFLVATSITTSAVSRTGSCSSRPTTLHAAFMPRCHRFCTVRGTHHTTVVRLASHIGSQKDWNSPSNCPHPCHCVRRPVPQQPLQLTSIAPTMSIPPQQAPTNSRPRLTFVALAAAGRSSHR